MAPFPEARKFWVAALGVLVQVLTLLDAALQFNILPEAWRPWVQIAIAVATAAGVYRVRNETARHLSDQR